MFSRFNPECDKKRHLFNLSFKGATLDGVAFSQTRLQQCDFDDTTLQSVDFFYSELDYCRFRKTEAHRVDFRYSHVDDCTMGKFKVELGDFYCCNFRGCTNFIDSCFKNCSFTCATFENACIRMSNIPEGIVQLHPTVYTEEIILSKDWFKYNPCATFSQMNEYAPEGNTLQSRIDLAKEAMDFYKQMSGTFAGKGLNRDSNEAYRQTKLCELDYYKEMKHLPKEDRKVSKFSLRWQIFCIRLIQAFGFGYKWLPPTLWFIGMTLFYAIIAAIMRNNSEHPVINFIAHWCRSLYNSMSPDKDFIDVINLPWASFESVFGVLIIGFLGFIIANNIRNDS